MNDSERCQFFVRTALDALAWMLSPDVGGDGAAVEIQNHVRGAAVVFKLKHNVVAASIEECTVGVTLQRVVSPPATWYDATLSEMMALFPDISRGAVLSGETVEEIRASVQTMDRVLRRLIPVLRGNKAAVTEFRNKLGVWDG